MNTRINNMDMDVTRSMAGAPRQELVTILEAYVGDLERGAAPAQEALLAAHPALADELRPYLESLRLLDGAAREMRGPQISADGTIGEPEAPRARQIGDYRISREIGRGGMGVVYEAHQKSLNRRVALKILPFAAVLDQRQIARFRNEAQAAAQLHHPHIVPVFAVGQEQGVYYYAMQYIDGQSLEQAIGELRRGVDERAAFSTRAAGGVNGSTTTMHADAASLLSLSHRTIRHGDFFQTVARLGREAAQALQHAHEYGIIHRDVKPSNLLLDHHGKLWVTDFGLARIQAGSGVTLTGDVVGTLRYMSPEQASGRSELIDTRTDVYSLGVTLYELMTLQQAFTGDDRQAVLRAIEHNEPRPPRQLNPAAPIDLETIVLQAMAKSRDERYQSAQALADDLERFLTGKPTQARRPTLLDRSTKWARRHRSLVTVGAIACLLLTLVSSVGMVLLAREQARTRNALDQAKSSAEAARVNFERAEALFRQAQDVVDQFGVRLADRLVQHPGTESLRYQLMTDTLRYYHDFLRDARENPELRHESALAHFKSGVLAAKLGRTEDAIAHYEKAQRLFESLVALNRDNDEYWQQLATTHNNFGLLLAARGDGQRARDQHEKAIAIQRRLVDDRPNEPMYVSQLAESQANLGMLFDQLDESAAAERSLRSAVDVLRPIAIELRDKPKFARNLAIAYNNLSFVLRKRDRAAAESAERDAIAILEPLTAKYSQAIQYQDDLALCYNNLAALVSEAGGPSDAIEWYARAEAIQEQLVRIAPAVVRHRSDLATTLNNLGVAHCRAAESEEADATFARAREIFTTLANDYPNELVYQGSLAGLLNNQAFYLAQAGRHDKALAIYPDAIAAQRACWEHSPDSTVLRDALSRMYFNHGQSLQSVGSFSAAADVALARRELWRDDGPRLYGVAEELATIGRAVRQETGAEGDLAAVEKIDRETVATLTSAVRHGFRPEADVATELASGERYAHLQPLKEFSELLAMLSSKPDQSDRQGSEGSGERDQDRVPDKDASSATSD